jgi:hypothetical protein
MAPSTYHSENFSGEEVVFHGPEMYPERPQAGGLARWAIRVFKRVWRVAKDDIDTDDASVSVDTSSTGMPCAPPQLDKAGAKEDQHSPSSSFTTASTTIATSSEPEDEDALVTFTVRDLLKFRHGTDRKKCIEILCHVQPQQDCECATSEESDLGVESPASHEAGNMELKSAATSWSAGQRARRSSLEEGKENLSDEEIVRTMKSILNKLTIEKFPKLSEQLCHCGIRTSSHLEVLIREILRKATSQHHFINMYGDLCVVLKTHFAKLDDQKLDVTKMLLRACQASFEKNLQPPTEEVFLEGEELESAKQLYKMQVLGNIKFIGALLCRRMLANKVMFAIMGDLLSNRMPEALESLAALLNVVGPTFDRPEYAHRLMLTSVLDQVEVLSKSTKVSPRVRCLLKDIVELRSTGWEDQKPQKLEGPSTLEEVAQKFHAETEVPKQQLSKSDLEDSWRADALQQQQHESGKVDPAQVRDARRACEAPPRTNSKPESVMLHEQAKTWNQKITTLMLNNVPREYTQDVLVEELTERLGEQGAFDFFYLPWDLKADRNMGFAFLNFSDAAGANRCMREFNHVGFRQSPRNKPCKVCPARMQGLYNNLRDFADRAVANHHTYYPIIQWNGEQLKLGVVMSALDDHARRMSSLLVPSDLISKLREQAKESHKQLAMAIGDLMMTQDVQASVARVGALGLPPPVQAEQLCDLMTFVVEADDATRALGLKFFVALFAEGHWKPAALEKGLESFANVCAKEHFQQKVPGLKKILRKEVAVSFAPLVSSGSLPGEQLQALATMSCNSKDHCEKFK